MIKRKISPVLHKLAGQFRVVTITGPRQCGKTTLVRMEFPDYGYVNLEDPEQRAMAKTDAREFLRLHPPPVIIDEVQRVPQLLSYIQVAADASKEKGRFILTGSHQPSLRAEIAQSLAGRTAILHLLPFSIEELSSAGISLDRDEYILKGFLPQLYDENIEPATVYRNYFLTYIERDALQLINLKHQDKFERFVRLLAGRIGQLVNLHSLSGDLGISSTTLAEWLSVLEASHIIFRLPFYYENIGKRLLKSPKLYFTEVGLAAYLLGIKTEEQVSRDPLLGGLFENMVVIEALKTRYNDGHEADLYFLRDSRGMEVDLALYENRRLRFAEIKAGRTYDTDFARSIQQYRTLLPDQKSGDAVLYAGSESPNIQNVSYRHFSQTASWIRGHER